MSKVVRRRFGRAFKLEVVRRMVAGESGTALSRELGVKRTILYRWRDAFRDGGEEALRDGPGRPKRAEKAAMALARGPAARARDLAEARRQIAELERKVGEQQVALDFFKGALQRIEASPPPSDGGGVTGSSPRSRR
ncbi:helix-turn-helix domain-containing protein [Sphingomonas sanxanigenens]|nr:helix-turn-helix domain-containing protein [Sphingomonas sanxanigenens]